MLDKHYLQELLRYFKPDQLPKTYGGTNTEVEQDRGLKGTKIPVELYYSTDKDPFYPGAEKIQKHTIRHGSKLKLKYEFSKAGHLRYWYTTEQMHYIIFAVYLIPKGSDPAQRKIIHPPLRLCTNHVPEKRELQIPEAGTVTIEFSNEASWFASKTVQYYFEVKC